MAMKKRATEGTNTTELLPDQRLRVGKRPGTLREIVPMPVLANLRDVPPALAEISNWILTVGVMVETGAPKDVVSSMLRDLSVIVATMTDALQHGAIVAN